MFSAAFLIPPALALAPATALATRSRSARTRAAPTGDLARRDSESAARVRNPNSKLAQTDHVKYYSVRYISVAINCGQSSSENCTYFESSSPTAGVCMAKICPCGDNICQVKKSQRDPLVDLSID